MKRRGLGIRTQLIAAITIMTVAGIGLIGLLSVKIVENSAVYWKVSQAEDLVKVVRASARPGGPGWGSGFAALALRESGVAAYRITGQGGKVIASEGEFPPGTGERVYRSGGMEAYRYGGGLFGGPGEALRVMTPVDGLGAAPGRLEFTLGLSGIAEDMSAVRKFILLYALLDSLIIIGFGVYSLSRLIVKPLKELEGTATRIAGGKLYERASVGMENEIGSLAGSFNSMAERLEDEIRSLERVNLELTNTQEELLRSSTLAAVGTLAAGIAHEIGNPLGAVRGYMELISRGGLSKDDEAEIIRRASLEAGRIDSIVREFLEVARPARPAASTVDVNALLKETLAALSIRPEFEGVNASMELEPGLPPVAVDEGKLRQVFSNLLINAAQSMDGLPEKPVTVRTALERTHTGVRARRRRGDQPVSGPYEREKVVISIEDRGKGVAEEDRGRVFDPFFTTKEAGRGTGLGLFVSQSIIRAYGGEITLRPAEGAGTVFAVTLPAEGRQ